MQTNEKLVSQRNIVLKEVIQREKNIQMKDTEIKDLQHQLASKTADCDDKNLQTDLLP
jgi:flagella basal body P-ring formation protein FlgA